MPSILNEEDKETVKRVVPKQTNKIQAVAVARLFVAYPNRQKWTYTGLQGAIVLANDLVGNTYWVKMVDISPAGRGVIWDQELFDTWSYNADRTFFHTFELEECWAGLSFVDEKEAKQFKKKMDDREKNASKATKNTPFGGTSQRHQKSGGFLSGLFGGHRHVSNPTPPESPRNSLPLLQPHARTSSLNLHSYLKPPSEFAQLDAYDPNWRQNFGNFLSEQGLADDFIKDNQSFIVDFLKQKNAEEAATATTVLPPPPMPPVNGSTGSVVSTSSTGHARAPPPPPPPPATRAASDGLSSSSGSRRGVPPPPPAPRRSGKLETIQREPTPPQEPTLPPRPRFNAPPALPDAGRYAQTDPPGAAPAGPPPPPRPPKTPINDKDTNTHKHGVPPAFTGQRLNNIPPPPPPREQPQAVPPPPPRPSKAPVSSAPSPPPIPTASRPVPAPPPRVTPPPSIPHSSAPAPPPPPPPPPSNLGVPPPPPPPGPGIPPPPPPLPPSSVPGGPPPPPPLPPSSIPGGPPPPPPLPPSSVPGGPPPPPPPPPPPNRDSGYSSATPAPALPSGDAGHSAMLAGIQKAGGIASLKKVDRSQIRDRSAAAVGGSDTGPHGSGLPPAGVTPGGPEGNMADALARALQERQIRTRGSDDEKSDDEW
ncbi:hypothetical protein F5Y12DRAFT_751506 [Xylaria sp. FL1777]|nr:hypothetical protein F5Y12DRAFT_751506 [Xylaria sp. FL1777]